MTLDGEPPDDEPPPKCSTCGERFCTKHWTKADVVELIEAWRDEQDAADAWRYADRMAQILDHLVKDMSPTLVLLIED